MCFETKKDIKQIQSGKEILENNISNLKRIAYLPQALLTQQPIVWATYLMKVYYKCVGWMLKNKGQEMRNCHKDSDWEYLCIDLDSWLKLLDMSFQETIDEKRIRIQPDNDAAYYSDDDDEEEEEEEKKVQNIEQVMILKVQMLSVVCELFILKQTSIYEHINFGKDVQIHWKNHYAPTITVLETEFIWWIFNYSHYKYKFPTHLYPINEAKTIVTYTESNKHKWNIYNFQEERDGLGPQSKINMRGIQPPLEPRKSNNRKNRGRRRNELIEMMEINEINEI